MQAILQNVDSGVIVATIEIDDRVTDGTGSIVGVEQIECFENWLNIYVDAIHYAGIANFCQGKGIFTAKLRCHIRLYGYFVWQAILLTSASQ